MKLKHAEEVRRRRARNLGGEAQIALSEIQRPPKHPPRKNSTRGSSSGDAHTHLDSFETRLAPLR